MTLHIYVFFIQFHQLFYTFYSLCDRIQFITLICYWTIPIFQRISFLKKEFTSILLPKYIKTLSEKEKKYYKENE